MKYSILAFVFLFGCRNNEHADYINSQTLLTDSFLVNGAQSLSEFYYFEPLDSCTLRSYNVEESTILYYKKIPQNNTWQKCSEIALSTKGYLPLLFKHQHTFYIGQTADNKGNNLLYKYDTTFHLIKEVLLSDSLPHLKNHFALNNNFINPMVSIGDTIISLYYHDNVASIPAYYLENSMMEAVFKNDSLQSVKTYISKPISLNHYLLRANSYCFNNNTIYLLYPQFDSIYSYKRTTQQEKTFAIHNPDFKQPVFFENSTTDEDYFKYETEYELSNFRYGAIVFNPITNHYILFYYLPMDLKNSSGQLTFRDQKEHALVLNSNFEVIHRVKFPYKYFNPASYFFCPGKGIAMPVFKSKSDYESILYYVYNL